MQEIIYNIGLMVSSHEIFVQIQRKYWLILFSAALLATSCAPVTQTARAVEYPSTVLSPDDSSELEIIFDHMFLKEETIHQTALIGYGHIYRFDCEGQFRISQNNIQLSMDGGKSWSLTAAGQQIAVNAETTIFVTADMTLPAIKYNAIFSFSKS